MGETPRPLAGLVQEKYGSLQAGNSIKSTLPITLMIFSCHRATGWEPYPEIVRDNIASESTTNSGFASIGLKQGLPP